MSVHSTDHKFSLNGMLISLQNSQIQNYFCLFDHVTYHLAAQRLIYLLIIDKSNHHDTFILIYNFVS